MDAQDIEEAIEAVRITKPSKKVSDTSVLDQIDIYAHLTRNGQVKPLIKGFFDLLDYKTKIDEKIIEERRGYEHRASDRLRDARRAAKRDKSRDESGDESVENIKVRAADKSADKEKERDKVRGTSPSVKPGPDRKVRSGTARGVDRDPDTKKGERGRLVASSREHKRDDKEKKTVKKK